jgi:dipeptidase E
MKLILASSGFNTPESIKKCVEFVGKPADEISFGVINEAYVPYHMPHDWVIDDLISIRDNFSSNIELIPLSLEIDEIKRRISDKDVIFVIGGNTAYLKTIFDKSGFSELLPELLKTKVYVGSSAGSMILGHCPTKETLLKTSGDDDDFSVTEYLNLLDLEIIPHIHGKFTLPTAEKQVIIESKKQPRPIYGISDNAAVIVEGDKTYVMGKDYLIAEKGKKVKEG